VSGAGPEASVRDALHVAVMRTIDDDAAASFDTRPARFGITK
jgi:predicted nucleic acid-binding protein